MRDQSTVMLHYPPARRADVVDDFHGTPVADPYRWLEDPDSPETRAWVAAQNALTREVLDAVPGRDETRRRLTAIWNYPKIGVPVRRGSRQFFTRNDGLQDQAVLFCQDGEAEPVALLDPNALAEDGTAALTDWWPGPDGSHLAYAISESGSDWQTIRVRGVTDGLDLEDTLLWCKFASVAWHPGGHGFFYNRFPEPSTATEAEAYRHSRVYWHTLGTAQDEDELVYERPDDPELLFLPLTDHAGRYLFLHVARGTDVENRLYFRRMDDAGPFVRWLDDADALYQLIAVHGDEAFLLTNLDAPRRRIIAADLTRPGRPAWRGVVPEGESVISLAGAAASQLALVRSRDAYHVLELWDLSGERRGEIPLPTMGSILELRSRPDQRELAFSFTSFLYPTTVYRYDVDSGMLETLARPEVDFDADAYETRQIFAASADGTRVPVFVTGRKGLALDGDNPTILFGYGGFSVDILPQFWVNRTVWLERGGVFAVAVLRGGNEYGEAWHRAGMLENKQNVFDDFIAAGEELVRRGYTRPGRLAIQGGSNGGLLVAACMLQRPDLYGAVHCAVPVIDMLRYHRFTIGRYWVGEYGNAEEDPAQFAYLYRYSPLHNVQQGRRYPPVLITTAESDDRVVPAHAWKFAATLQADADPAGMVLLRVEPRAGHGLGKPTTKLIDEQVDLYAFLHWALESGD